MKKIDINSEKCIGLTCSDSQIDKPQRGCPKRAELLDVNYINTGVQSNNTERDSLSYYHLLQYMHINPTMFSFSTDYSNLSK